MKYWIRSLVEKDDETDEPLYWGNDGWADRASALVFVLSEPELREMRLPLQSEWVDEHDQPVRGASAEASAPGWVKQLLKKRAALEQILDRPVGDMLGCGHWGCVFDSTPPWVVKFTRDPTEGAISAKLRQFVADTNYGADGVARIKDIIRITPDIRWRRGTYPLHAIVREAVYPVSHGAGFSVEYTPYTRHKLGIPEGLRFPVGGNAPPAMAGEMWGIRANELAALLEGLLRYRRAAEDWHKKRSEPAREAAEEKLYAATNLMDGPIGGYIGETLTVLQSQGIVLRDVHWNNIGWRAHTNIDDEELPDTVIIFDPGHTPTEGGLDIPERLLRNPIEPGPLYGWPIPKYPGLGAGRPAWVELKPPLRLYHGTSTAEEIRMPTPPAWFTESKSLAKYFAGSVEEAHVERGPRPRVLAYEVARPLYLVPLASSIALSERIAKLTGIPKIDVRKRTTLRGHVAHSICSLGVDGWIIPDEFGRGQSDILLCDPEGSLVPIP